MSGWDRTPSGSNPLRLIYLSPLPYNSFAQRPHRFVEWFHDETGGEVLWVAPYPTRLPKLSDFRRVRLAGDFDGKETFWLKSLHVPALPVEPLPGNSHINRPFWKKALREIERFHREGPAILVIGKPSAFADLVLSRLPGIFSIYDMMDNFPAFYSGLSSRKLERCERRIIERVSVVVCSSTNLTARALQIRPDARLVHNALNPDPLLTQSRTTFSSNKLGRVFGYVGTIAKWFDWDFVRGLALARPKDVVWLIGPMFQKPSYPLPPNINLHSAVSHRDAMNMMIEFDVALIPFKTDPVTWGVDPIKYYEYKAYGLPIITSNFGEMSYRKEVAGVFTYLDGTIDVDTITESLKFRASESERLKFIENNNWSVRFQSCVSPMLDM